MEIGNQQGRMLYIDYIDYKECMLYGIDLNNKIKIGFSTEDNLKFILNINQGYNYFLKNFGLTRDQTKRIKKKIFDQYRLCVPNKFKVIKDYEHYLVNEYGVVINKATRRILRQALNAKGYPMVCLTGKQSKTVHRLVATTWLSNINNKPEVNHIDGNKLNNFKSNLEWCTQQENATHKRINNLGKTEKAKMAATGQNNSQSKLRTVDVLNIRSLNSSSKHLSIIYKVSQHTINDIRSRRSWKHI